MPLSIGKVRVDVSLCGALPRPCHTSSSCGPSRSAQPTTPAPLRRLKLPLVTSSKTNESLSSFPQSCFSIANGQEFSTQVYRCKISPSTANFSGESIFSSTNSFDTIPSSDIKLKQNCMHLPMLEPPQWAVPARGDSRLEPVCEAIGSHPTIDLTKQACFRVGRSPGSDVQLLHNTSSRRHALIVHHPNGGCYVVDCGSSHGTYVNGVRVRSTPSGSMVIPHRVKRGSLIRFGGPGAPTFVLKSFSVGFSAMVKELESPISSHSGMSTAKGNSRQLYEGGILKKRSFDEVSVQETKRQRCISPASTMLETGPIRLVSPESPRKSKRVSFHEQPEAFYPVLVTPDVLSSDDEDVKS